ncbi:nucleoside hydrolase-like domain-containing protein [Gelidibacter salicanalis]|uniref:DUF1593 domain-containing protein n=1 Tax=Gelidibacter salicanalis TaxID=291193 RepID=A0A934KNG9_9FLAO|nr:nucleoside hydrolase-like domain-containing protein [Gelidibacter salicanalis]MBJ7880524.1 DUF1593 domain-containing protein [Gelidibacter salicanalis]
MKNILIIILLVFVLNPDITLAQSTKQRLIILADMGHDPDDEQQIVHLLMGSYKFDLEGLITVTGRFFRKNPTETVKDLRPELFYKIIDGYEKVYPNLKLHAEGWKTPEYLKSIVANGQAGNGMKDVGAGKATAGSDLIINSVLKNDDRPLTIVANAGTNTLAQALYDYRASHTKKELDAFVSKLRVFDNGGQDECGAWICHEFPEIFWIRSNYQTRSFGGPSNNELGPITWQPFENSPKGQHDWAKENIQTNHGALGAVYPDRNVNDMFHFIGGGGTIPWMGALVPGLSDISNPWWGGWSGRYSREKIANVPGYSIVVPDELQYYPYSAFTDGDGVSEKWVNPEDGKIYEGKNTAIWRWRQAMWNDLKCRMDWCVEPFENANHPPEAVINGNKEASIKMMSVKAGEIISLDASASSDPDNDELDFNWWIYTEAGTYKEEIKLSDSNRSKMSIKIPSDAKGKSIHLILEVKDNSAIASLYDYRRIIFSVE